MKFTFESLGNIESIWVRLVRYISDIIAVSTCKVLIFSARTFCIWASFLGQSSTIWFSGQMRLKLFKVEVDCKDLLAASINTTHQQ